MTLTAVLQTQGLVSTRSGRIVASLLVAGGFVATLAAIRRLGPPLKDRYPADDVEAVQAVMVTVVAALTSWLLVVVWQAVDTLVASLSVTGIGARESALALVGVLILIIAYTLTRVTRGLLERGDGDVITAHRREVIHHILQLIIWIVAGMVVLSLAGINPANLLVGAGAVGLVVGLAARQTLGAILAGIVLLFARPLEVGDWIVIDDNEGVVTDVTLFNTKLRTWDDEHVMIPNDQVTTSAITNRSRSGRLRITVEVGIDYEADVDRAVEIAEETLRECDVAPVLSTPSPSVIGQGFGDSAILLECRAWISNPTAHRKWETQTAIIREIQTAFEEADITIPYPQRELSAREGGNGIDPGATVRQSHPRQPEEGDR